MTDGQLLSAHLAGDPDAFRRLVARHIDLIHAAATRQAPDFADDITQAVLILLSQKAASLRHRASLAGWLFTTTRLCASHARRAAQRRRSHEREAAMLTPRSSPQPSDHLALLPLLDDALAALPSAERELVLQHHLQSRPLAELAADLRISVPAAAKRAQRAVDRLRHWFTARGTETSAPALTALLLSQSAHHAPTALATSAATAAATALAKSVTPWLLLTSSTVKTAAAIALITLLTSTTLTILTVARAPGAPGGSPVAIAAPLPTSPPSPLPTLPAATIAALKTYLVRYNVVLDETGAAGLRQGFKPQPTTSRNYTAYRGSSADVIRALRAARDAAHLAGFFMQQRVQFDPTVPGDLYTYFHDGFEIVTDGQRFLGDLNVPQGKAGAVRRDGDALGLSLAIPVISIGYRPDTTFEWATYTGSLQFEGRLDADESLLFFADPAQVANHKLTHVAICQAFQAQESQLGTIAKISQPLTWIRYGTDGICTLAGRALVWQAEAPDLPIPQRFSRKLPSGATITLIAVGSPAAYPFCWWRPDGLPADRDWSDAFGVSLDTSAALVVTLDPPQPAPAFVSPLDRRNWWGYGLTNVPNSAGNTQIYGSRNPEAVWPIAGDLDHLDIGVATGPWADTASMSEPGESQQGKLSVMFTGTHEQSGTTRADFQIKAPDDVDVHIIAVDHDGKRFDVVNSKWPPSQWPTITLGHYHEDAWQKPIVFGIPITPEKIDHWIIQTRRREWTTFENFAVLPANPPRESVTPAEVAAAGAKLAYTAHARTESLTAARRLALEELLRHPDPRTPEGSKAALIAHARAGDVTGVRALLAPTEGQGPLADAIARNHTAWELLGLAATNRFGPDAARKAGIRGNDELNVQPYEVYENHAWRLGKLMLQDTSPDMILIDGQWRTLISGQHPPIPVILAYAACYDALRARLDAGEFPTSESLRDALYREISAATQRSPQPASQPTPR